MEIQDEPPTSNGENTWVSYKDSLMCENGGIKPTPIQLDNGDSFLSRDELGLKICISQKLH